MLEPADSQEAYDFFLAAVEISERWQIPVLFRMTTRVCHSKSIVTPRPPAARPAAGPLRARHAGPGHDPGLRPPGPPRACAQKLAEIAAWNETVAAEPRRGGRPGARHHQPPASPPCTCARPRPSAALLKLGLVLPAAAREAAAASPPSVRALRGGRGGRPGHRRGPPRRRHRRRGEAGDVPLRRARRGARAAHPGPRRLAGAGAPARQAARALPGLPVPPGLRHAPATWTASWRATSAATRWACCRPSRPWTPASAWAPRIGVGLGLRHVLPPEAGAQGGLASSATAPSCTAASPAWWRWSTTRRPPATWCWSSTTAPPP